MQPNSRQPPVSKPAHAWHSATASAAEGSPNKHCSGVSSKSLLATGYEGGMDSGVREKSNRISGLHAKAEFKITIWK